MSEPLEIDTGTHELLAQIRNSVAIVTLNRPEARNAFPNRLLPVMGKLIERLGEDPKVRSILITGAGTAFCAGGDVKDMGQSSATPEPDFEQRVIDLIVEGRMLTGTLVATRKPTVAAIPGPAAGAGLALALACDIRIAAQSAFFTTAFSASGDRAIAQAILGL
ncbi:enoyl-CoA hydratase-related protein [Bradyrhizobium sp. LLZ17]|uniref:Enoyl-CoA hydratase-related protein n=1 Tax=Bradyrhizobium sp. LLZ17 TaxID=3239388 RepID=A0AB39XVS6_9BRAD